MGCGEAGIYIWYVQEGKEDETGRIVGTWWCVPHLGLMIMAIVGAWGMVKADEGENKYRRATESCLLVDNLLAKPKSRGSTYEPKSQTLSASMMPSDSPSLDGYTPTTLRPARSNISYH